MLVKILIIKKIYINVEQCINALMKKLIKYLIQDLLEEETEEMMTNQ